MKRIITLIIIALGLMFAGTASASTYCGGRSVPNTDQGVANVRATFVACPDAVRFAFRLDTVSHANLHGFRCHFTPITHGLAGSYGRCSRGRQRISFEAY